MFKYKPWGSLSVLVSSPTLTTWFLGLTWIGYKFTCFVSGITLVMPCWPGLWQCLKSNFQAQLVLPDQPRQLFPRHHPVCKPGDQSRLICLKLDIVLSSYRISRSSTLSAKHYICWAQFQLCHCVAWTELGKSQSVPKPVFFKNLYFCFRNTRRISLLRVMSEATSLTLLAKR